MQPSSAQELVTSSAVGVRSPHLCNKGGTAERSLGHSEEIEVRLSGLCVSTSTTVPQYTGSAQEAVKHLPWAVTLLQS